MQPVEIVQPGRFFGCFVHILPPKDEWYSDIGTALNNATNNCIIEVYANNPLIKVEDADVMNNNENIYTLKIDLPDNGEKYVRKSIKIVL